MKKSHVPPKMMFTQVKTYLQKWSKNFLWPLTILLFPTSCKYMFHTHWLCWKCSPTIFWGGTIWFIVPSQMMHKMVRFFSMKSRVFLGDTNSASLDFNCVMMCPQVLSSSFPQTNTLTLWLSGRSCQVQTVLLFVSHGALNSSKAASVSTALWLPLLDGPVI